MEQQSELIFHKAWRSGGQGGNCVEVAKTLKGDRVVRNSRDPDGPTLTFTVAEWAAFVGDIKDGNPDLI